MDKSQKKTAGSQVWPDAYKLSPFATEQKTPCGGVELFRSLIIFGSLFQFLLARQHIQMQLYYLRQRIAPV